MNFSESYFSRVFKTLMGINFVTYLNMIRVEHAATELKISGNRVLDILEEEPMVKEINGQKEVAFHGAKAEHVTFFLWQETILKDVSADIKENSVVGIIGKSGSGKSTLLKLLMRFLGCAGGKCLHIRNRRESDQYFESA